MANATRLGTIPTIDQTGKISYWLMNDQVYRLNEYEPVKFDIYGMPLGARWECSLSHFEEFQKLFLKKS